MSEDDQAESCKKRERDRDEDIEAGPNAIPFLVEFCEDDSVEF